MARIKLPAVSELTAEQQQQYARFPANLTLGLLKTSRSAQGYLSLGASFPAGRLCDKDREMIILRVGALSDSAYERMQHYPLAILAGWHDDDIEKIERSVGIDARGTAILHFVDECVKQVKVSADTFNAVRRYYDEVQLAELALMIGHYMMTARFWKRWKSIWTYKPHPGRTCQRIEYAHGVSAIKSR